jgi:hypothetical protein
MTRFRELYFCEPLPFLANQGAVPLTYLLPVSHSERALIDHAAAS